MASARRMELFHRPRITSRRHPDGLSLQSFLVRSDKLNKALPQSERTLSPGLSAYELAEIIVDDMKVDPAFNALSVLNNEPALIGGQPGFKVTLAYRNAGI